MKQTYPTIDQATVTAIGNGVIVAIETDGITEYAFYTHREYSLAQLRSEKILRIKTIGNL